MATQKVIYFIAGTVPTTEELSDISKLNAAGVAAYETLVVSSQQSAEYSAGRPIPADFVAGTVPDAYKVDQDPEEDPIYPVIDPDAIPSGVADNQVVFTDGDELTIDEIEGIGSIAVTDSVAVISLGAEAAIVQNGVILPVSGPSSAGLQASCTINPTTKAVTINIEPEE